VEGYDLTFKCTVYAVGTNNAQNIIFIYDVGSFWYLKTTISIMFLKTLLTILTINKSDTGESDTLMYVENILLTICRPTATIWVVLHS